MSFSRLLRCSIRMYQFRPSAVHNWYISSSSRTGQGVYRSRLDDWAVVPRGPWEAGIRVSHSRWRPFPHPCNVFLDLIMHPLIIVTGSAFYLRSLCFMLFAVGVRGAVTVPVSQLCAAHGLLRPPSALRRCVAWCSLYGLRPLRTLYASLCRSRAAFTSTNAFSNKRF